MVENFSNLSKDVRLHIQESEWTSNKQKNKTNPQQDTLQSDFWKLETKKNLESSKREMTHSLIGENNPNDNVFLIRNHRGQCW